MGSIMIKPSFLAIDFQTSVRLTSAQRKSILKYLDNLSPILPPLIKQLLPVLDKKQRKVLKGMQLSLLLCGEDRMKKLNHEYRGKNKVTDVLSFPAYENLRHQWQNVQVHQGILFLGDIAICHQQVKRQAREFAISYADEILHLFIHGVLHLLGYDHELSEKEDRLMQDWEAKLLTKVSRAKKRGLEGP